MRALASLLLVALLGQGAAGAEPWRVCITNAVVPPYLSADPARPGVIERLLVDAGRELDLQVQLLRVPLERCRLMLQSGAVDAMLAAPIAANLQLLDFPLRDGQPDRERLLASGRLVWVKPAGSPASWDGRELGGLAPRPRVGVRHGMKVGAEALARLPVQLDQGSLDSATLLRRLRAGRFELAAMLSHEFMHEQRSHAEFAELQMLDPPLLRAEFYAGVRKDLDPALRPRVQAWWAAMARLREQPAYRP